MENLTLEKALAELRKEKERKFNQSVELIVNLKKFDVRKTQINTFVNLPHITRVKNVCGFLEEKSSIVDTIPKAQFIGYKDKKKLKELVSKYDFFIASAPNMPAVATTFGRVLGPAGKMPSPKLGIIAQENEDSIKEVVDRINKTLRVQTKEASIKVMVGKEKMSDKEIVENINAVYKAILKELPLGKENVKSIMVKFTMTKPLRVEI